MDGSAGPRASPAELRPHEVVAVLDELHDEVVRDAAVEGDRQPVPLVQVVAGDDRAVGGAQPLAELRIALHAHAQRARRERREREHLLADLEDARLRSERELLAGAAVAQTLAAKLLRVHASPRAARSERAAAPARSGKSVAAVTTRNPPAANAFASSPRAQWMSAT